MKKKNQSEIVKERFTKSVNMEQKISEPIETMLVGISNVVFVICHRVYLIPMFRKQPANLEKNVYICKDMNDTICRYWKKY